MLNYLVSSYPNRGITFEKGEGLYLIDTQSKKFLDLGSNYGVNILGYGHDKINSALNKQISNLINLHGSFSSIIREEAAKKLVTKCSGKLSRVFFSNSGAEAIEAALKFARLATGKSHFIAMDHGYHGKTLGALSATGGDKYRAPFLPLIWNFTHIPFGDTGELKKAITNDIGAIITEPIQGEGGIKFASKKYFHTLQEICRENNILLIVDEIQTGIGRTGTFLASGQFNMAPDILCLGKGLGGGIPVGATLVTENIAAKIPMHIHTSTFGGNPLSCAGIIATLKELDDKKLQDHIKKTGNYFLSELKKLKSEKIVEVRGIGLMLAIELVNNATWVLKALQDKYIIAIPAGSNIIRFLPPYLISRNEIDFVINELKKIFNN